MGFHCGWIEVHAVDHCNNVCSWCHNSSPFSPEKEYNPNDYTPWFDILNKNNIPFHKISIMGGEPFLHSDIIGFIKVLYEKYPDKNYILTTNGFWLNERNIEKYEELWKILYSLSVSFYPNIIKKIGGERKARLLLDKIKKKFPNIQIHIPDKTIFRELSFHSTKHIVDKFCGNSDCIALLSDGKMARCGAGGFSHLNPYVTEEFKNATQMFYDLNNFDCDSFWLWRNRYPLDACSYCGLLEGESHKWQAQKKLQQLKIKRL